MAEKWVKLSDLIDSLEEGGQPKAYTAFEVLEATPCEERSEIMQDLKRRIKEKTGQEYDDLADFAEIDRLKKWAKDAMAEMQKDLNTAIERCIEDKGTRWLAKRIRNKDEVDIMEFLIVTYAD